MNKLTLDNYFDKIFYINLKEDVSRNQHMITQFSKYGINNYERIDAIKYGSLPDILFYRNFIRHEIKYIIGSLSCRASHKKCIQLAYERGYDKILILEDDVLFLQDPNELLNANCNILNDWDMLYFGGLIEENFRNQIVCAHAYAIRKSTYADIILMMDASGMEVDNFYAKILHHMSYNYNQSGKYNIRTIFPFNRIVQNKSYISNIQS